MRCGVVLGIVILALVSCSDVAHVERITFVNAGDFPARVDVTDENRSGWLGIGIVPSNQETSFDEVIDQGETWVFRFDYAAKHQEEIELSRSDLERNRWTVEVPAEFEATLRELGVSPVP